MRTCVRVLTWLGLGGFALCTLTAATQVTYLTPQDLAQHSQAVVRGKVISVDSYWNDNHTKIFTRTRIHVDETYKGNPQPVIDVIQLGGVVGNVKVTVHGSTRWEVGEEVLLFAEPYKAGDFQVAGFSQGKFGIIRDPKTGQAYVRVPVADETTLLGASPGRQHAPVSRQKMVPVDEFVERALGRR